MKMENVQQNLSWSIDDNVPESSTTGKEITRADLLWKSINKFGLSLDTKKAGEPATNITLEVQPGSTTAQLSDGEIVSSLDLPQYRDIPSPRQISFTPLQEWEGYVVEVDKDSFTARLVDLTAGDHFENEEADFPIDDLSDADKHLLKPGAIFRWAIGYQRSIGGTKQRVSRLVMRRLPQWTERDIREANQEAARLSKLINWE